MRTATYARYSSENQRETSIDDQLRDTAALCAQHGFPAPAVYKDAEISGMRRDRPGYVAMLRDAEAGAFNVLVLWDLKRLSRAEDLPQVLARLQYWKVRVIACDGYDSALEGSDIRGWIDGLMGNRYLRDLAKATHRGLTGKVLSGSSGGGLPFGYRVTTRGHRAIDEAQAEVVRRVFAEYLQGMTPRAIAAGLNRDGVPSSRGGTWSMTAIHGDQRRGIGMLVNPIYVGRPVWNRSRWVKHPETGRRERQERPESEWMRQDLPELAIVSEATWQAVQARLRGCSAPTGSAGRPMRHLLSGLLKCGECGGPLVVVDAYNYGCSTARDRATCASRLRVRRKVVEEALLSTAREHLLSDEAFQRYQRAFRASLKKTASDPEAAKRKLADAEREHGNIMAAIRAGIITPSTKAELLKAEASIAEAKAEVAKLRQAQPDRMVPRMRERWDGLLAVLSEKSRNLPQAREALKQLIGEATIRNENGDLFAEIAGSHLAVVAGAGFVRYLRDEPLRIPLRSRRAS